MKPNVPKSPPPTWFWIVAVLTLVWNLFGIVAFLMQVGMSPADVAALPEAQRRLYETQPIWVVAVFAVAVFPGTFGNALLLLRKRQAFWVLVLSLLGVLAQMSYLFFLSDTFKVMGRGAMVVPILVIVVAVFLVWLARKATLRGWIW